MSVTLKKIMKIFIAIVAAAAALIAFAVLIIVLNYRIEYKNAVSQCEDLYGYYCEHIINDISCYRNVSEYLSQNIEDKTLYSEDIRALFSELLMMR